MTPLFKKLNYKDQPCILVLNAPESMAEEEKAMLAVCQVKRSISASEKFAFALVFATKKAELDAIIVALAPKLEGDAILWIAYPKGSSKKYKADFNRDNGWEKVGEHGLEPVRQVAIDSDWSALRFRKVEYIKSMTRRKEMTLSAEGKEKTTGE